MRRLLLLLFLCSCCNITIATSWSPVQPYKIFSSGSSIVIDAIPYAPYEWQTSLGETRVYSSGRLLYTIDRYFSVPVFTSNDGKYLVAVYNTNSFHSEHFIKVKNRSAIEIYRNGRVYKRFTMLNVVDTASLKVEGVSQLSYCVDWDREKIRHVQFECEACRETYSEQILASCDASEIESDECAECRSACDSFSLYQRLKRAEENAISMRGDTLHILTQQGLILEVYLSSKPGIRRSRVRDKTVMAIMPPSAWRKEESPVEWPGRMDLPQLANGDSVATELRKLFRDLGRYDSKKKLGVHITSLVLDSFGRCEYLEIYPMTEEKDWQKHFYKYSAKKVSSIISEWIKKQRFETSLIPLGFKKYSFEGYIDI